MEKALLARQHELFLKSMAAGVASQAAQQTTSEARLVEEHFMKAGLGHMAVKSEPGPAAYSLYGYQSQAFPHKYVSKDQLQQQLCKEERLDKSSSKLAAAKEAANKLATPPRTVTTSAESSIGSHANYSSQLIQEGLIPNPAYAPHAPHGSASTNTPSSNSSNSMSALVNMSLYAGRDIADRYNKDKSPTIKSEPRVQSRNSQSHAPSVPSTVVTSSNANEQQQPGLMKSFKTYIENAVTQAFYKDIEEQKSKGSPTRSPMAMGAGSVKLEKSTSNGAMDTDSDTLSAPSPTLSVKTEGQDCKPCHPKMKLKKEWLQRHAEGGATCPTTSSSPTSAASGTLLNSSNASNLSETTTSASETESEQQVIAYTILCKFLTLYEHSFRVLPRY